MHGTYVRGWKYDWEAGRKEYDRLLAVGRETAAAFSADPGCVSCPACGTTHWREFEVFTCRRCGAEVTIGTRPRVHHLPGGRAFHSTEQHVTAGPPAFPDKVPAKLADGLRVRWAGKPLPLVRRGKPVVDITNRGTWLAGPVEPGTLGTVRRGDESYLQWHVEWDGLVAEDGHRWGLIGPFLDDELEVA